MIEIIKRVMKKSGLTLVRRHSGRLLSQLTRTEWEKLPLSDGIITLRLTEQNPGDGEYLPYNYYDILDADGPVGKISVRFGDNAHAYYNGHIGYEIDEAYRGKHYALRACELVLPVARAHGLRYIYLTCREGNTASRRTIERLGAELLEITDIPEWCFFWRPGIEKYCIYKLYIGPIT